MYISEEKEKKPSNYRQDAMQTKAGSVVCIFERKSSLVARALDVLERENFAVRTYLISDDIIHRLKQFAPALIMIATTSVEGVALEVCQKIRRVPWLNGTPVVLLAANASEHERVLGLESGADDYITESSSSREIVARVKALIRRFGRSDLPFRTIDAIHPFVNNSWFSLSPSLKVGDIEIDASAMTIAVRGSVIAATQLEFRLLYYLLHNQGRVLSRDQLLNAVWDADFVEQRSVDACIRRLRRKIEPHPVRPTYLKTVRGAGYCFKGSEA
jgi:DNA-binding response OmpR family regulator